MRVICLFMNIGQSGNPLDLIFSQVRTGASQNFITKSAEAKPKSEDTTSERPSGFMPAEKCECGRDGTGVCGV